MRLNLPIPTLEEIYKKEKVQEDRYYAIDAAIIRIMKTRKRLEWGTLMGDVLQAMTLFKPQPAMIKKRIERLIETDYLERDKEDKTVLNYLAWAAL